MDVPSFPLKVVSTFFSFALFTAWSGGTFNGFLFMYGVYFFLLGVMVTFKTVTLVLAGQRIANSIQECK